MNEDLTLKYVDLILKMLLLAVAVLGWDSFGGHITDSVNSASRNSNIISFTKGATIQCLNGRIL